MSTPHPIDPRLHELVNLGDSTTKKLVEIIIENYNNNNLDLGISYGRKYVERKTFFTLVDSEFENVFLHLVYYADSKYSNINSYLYEIKLEARGLESPIEMVISLDDYLINILPEKLKKDLEDKLNEDFL